MDFLKQLFKYLPHSMIMMAVSIALDKAGRGLKDKDADAVGADDAFGGVLLALAPAIAAYDEKQDKAFKKLLRVAWVTLGTYIGETPKPVETPKAKGEK